MTSKGPLRVLHLAPSSREQSGIARYARRYRELFDESPRVDIHEFQHEIRRLNTVRDTARYVWAARARALEGFDVVHAECGGGTLGQFWAGLVIATTSHVAVTLTIHDPPYPVTIPFHVDFLRRYTAILRLTHRLSRPAARRLEALLLHRAAAIMVLSVAARGELVELLGPAAADQVTMIPHVPGVRAQWQPGPPGETFGYLGYWYPGKGLETLVEAARFLHLAGHAAHFRLWGEATMSAGARVSMLYRQRIAAQIEAGGLAGFVEMAGWLPEERIPEELARLRAVVLPYDRGSSLSASGAAIDALAAGCPVIASNTRALSEVIVDGDNGLLVPPGDAAALAAAVLRVSRDDRLAATLRDGARETSQRLSASVIVNAGSACYERIAGYV